MVYPVQGSNSNSVKIAYPNETWRGPFRYILQCPLAILDLLGPPSPPSCIFILAVELLKIKRTKNLRGITYAKKVSRSETFADDTSIFIQKNPTYRKECVKIVKHFAITSG